jgi:hypothetical protein
MLAAVVQGVIQDAINVDTKNVVHYFRVMKNVTITLDEETARWAKVEAARSGKSLSRMLGELLRERRLGQVRYEQARKDFMAREPQCMNRSGATYPDREEIHDRTLLR